MFLTLTVDASLRESLTWDEPSFISAGLAYLTQGDFRFNPSHPPLLQSLEAFPLVLMGVRRPQRRFEQWEGNAVVGLGHSLIFESGNDPDRITFWARLPISVLGAALVPAVYLWGRRLYGPKPALVAVALTALCPNIVAHAGLAAEDLGCTVLMFFAAWSFWLAHEDGGGWRWARCGLLTGLAFVAKYTALLLAPGFVIIAGASLLARCPSCSWRRWLRALLIVAGVAALVVSVAYGPRFGWPLYVRGFMQIYKDLVPLHYYYLAGRYSETGWWYYTLAAFVFKVSAATLLILLIAFAFLLRKGERRRDVLFVLVPAALVVAASFLDRTNLGLRRILPAIPFLYLFASRAALPLAGSLPRLVRGAALPALLLWTATETVMVHPHELSFISAVVGGPTRGPWLLSDSNIDWGQDLPALAAWQRKHPDAGTISLLYFGTAEPAAYGLRTRPVDIEDLVEPRPGTYAISAHMLVYLRLRARELGPGLDWLSRFEQVGRAGYSIYIYQVGRRRTSTD